MARAPRPVGRAYLELLSIFSRSCPPLAARIENSVCGHKWPPLAFRARSVTVAGDCTIRLLPHLGEFDQAALFKKRLDYEPAVFEWLRENAVASYDTVLEIGANVGVYTVFLATLMAKSQGSRLKTVIAFEPAIEPYRRLLENLRVNGAGRRQHVVPIQAAVGVRSGLQAFFAPEGHLTNGSLIREFAERFADRVEESLVPVVAAGELERWLEGLGNALIKIDVEGSEPDLLAALAPLVDRHRPDLILEVLDATVQRLQQLPIVAQAQKFLLTPGGLTQSATLFASRHHRDWLLRFPPAA